jgi:hypothetical protein
MFYLGRAPLPELHAPAELAEALAPGRPPALAIAQDTPGLPGEALARGYWRGRQFVILANRAAADRIRAAGR